MTKHPFAPDSRPRCEWSYGGMSEAYIRYHDEEWGVPAYDDRKQFEFLILEGAQAGLSWSTILNKREGYREAFADFDVQKRAITNLKAIANEDQKPIWFAYPRWIDGEAAVVYHAKKGAANGELYLYRLKDGTTRRVSTNAGADYRYPHGEAAPN